MSDFDLAASALVSSIEDEIFSGRLVFPTSLDLTLRIKRLADSPSSSLDDIAHAVRAEPLLSAKVVRMANAVALNPAGTEVTNVVDAVRRVGLSALRCLAFAVASEQLASDQRDPHWRELAGKLWLHSAENACWAFALARTGRTVAADSAMFAGMLVDIGPFFLLSRVPAYPDMAASPRLAAAFIAKHHAGISASLLLALDIPEALVDAIHAPRQLDNWPPVTMAEVLNAAAACNRSTSPFCAVEVDNEDLLAPYRSDPRLPEIQSQCDQLLSTLTA